MIEVFLGNESQAYSSYETFCQHSNVYGAKCAGLLSLPPAWCPEFIGISIALHQAVSAGCNVLETEDFSNILAWARERHSIAGQGFILRSSAVHESIEDRGRYLSLRLRRQFDTAEFCEAANSIYEHAAQRGLDGYMALVLQVFFKPDAAGHLSNETRVSATRNQWQYELTFPTWAPPKGLNSRYALAPDRARPLKTPSQLHSTLRSVGRWATEAQKTRTHIEWIVSDQTLYVVQLDPEWDECDSGIDPDVAIDARSGTEPIADAANVFERHYMSTPTEWKKLINLHDFDFDNLSEPRLFVATGAAIASALSESKDRLAQEISSLTAGRAVIRTDAKSDANLPSFNLPRTDTVNGQNACSWLETQIKMFHSQGVDLSKLAFIMHTFLPAHAGVWAYADPGAGLAYVDALWGLPDGLQVLPHDSYQVDIARRRISAERIRFKPRFLREEPDGSWIYTSVRRKKGRNSTLPRKDVLEIGLRTAAIADKLGQRAQIMWFSGVPASYGVQRNLPWFRARDFFDPAPREIPRYKPFQVRSLADLESLPAGPVTLKLNPEAELIREDRFFDEVIKVASEKKLPVEIEGSILSHTYYRLYQAGIAVSPPNSGKYSRSRGKRVFGKLVRDGIPDKIKKGGEEVSEAKLRQSDACLVLLGKLLEEAFEFKAACSSQEAREELSDLLEIILSLAKVRNIDWDEIVSAADSKRERLGSFDERRVLIETRLPSPKKEADTLPEVRASDLFVEDQIDNSSTLFPLGAIFLGGLKTTLRVGDTDIDFIVILNSEGLKISLEGVDQDEDLHQLELFC